MRKALADMGRIGADGLSELAGDRRHEAAQRATVLARHMRAESMSAEQLADGAVQLGVASRQRVVDLVQGAAPSSDELSALAAVLSVREADLLVVPLESSEEVVVTHIADATVHTRTHMPARMRMHMSKHKSGLCHMSAVRCSAVEFTARRNAW